MPNLTELIDSIDLPSLVAEHFPESGARPGYKGSLTASWRNESNASASLYKSDKGGMMLKDHGTGECYNAYQFLTKVVNMPYKEALQVIHERTGHAKDFKVPVSEPIKQRWESKRVFGAIPPQVLTARGFTQTDMQLYGFAIDGEDLLIPIYDNNGVIVAIKRRLARGKTRYVYEEEGYGSPPWVSPNYQQASSVMIIEGELNAIIAHSVLLDDKVAMIGVAGADAMPPHYLFRNKNVYVYADNDKPGDRACTKWSQLAIKNGARKVSLITAQDKDFCDIAGQDGRVTLFNFLSNALDNATPLFTIADRMVGHYTVRELRDSAKKYISQAIGLPTGFTELDDYTGGLPESGITLLCALPSFGKSMLLRDILIYLIMNKDKKVMLFSPDQSIPSIFRLIASKLSGVPLQQLRNHRFSPELLNRFGNPVEIATHWGTTYDWAITELSQRLILSEADEMTKVREALTEGVYHHGVNVAAMDYIQLFEPEDSKGGYTDGRAAKDVKKLVTSLKIPFIACCQLAKYKFDRNQKRDGIPYASDIEGSGKYYQAADMVLMIYNHYLYWDEYIDPENEPNRPIGYHNDNNRVRVYLRKNKDGPFGDFTYLDWNKSLASFDNPIPKGVN